MCILLQWGKQASKLQLGYNLYTKNQKQNRKYKKKEKNKRKSRGTPCFGGALNMFCISSRTESSWMTQWSLQWRAFLKSSTSSLPSSNSPISGFFFFWGALCFLVDLEWTMTVSWGPCFGEPSVRSIIARGVPWAGALNPNPGVGGM